MFVYICIQEGNCRSQFVTLEHFGILNLDGPVCNSDIIAAVPCQILQAHSESEPSSNRPLQSCIQIASALSERFSIAVIRAKIVFHQERHHAADRLLDSCENVDVLIIVFSLEAVVRSAVDTEETK